MNDEPAFPFPSVSMSSRGMTLRDYFAAQALQGLTAKYGASACDDWGINHAYEAADRMLTRRANH